jgi:hypothetical protein
VSLVVADDDGLPRAFANTCRHRGARLVDDAEGRLGRIQCPYHAWSYGVVGAPLGAAPAPPGPVRPATAAALRLPLRAGDVGPDGNAPPEACLALLREAREAWWRDRAPDARTALAVSRSTAGARSCATTNRSRCRARWTGSAARRSARAERIETAGGELVALAEATLVVLDGSRPRAMTGAEREALCA